ncbi:MAG TPA: DUF427 domain-containing protein [Kofleriaceae bacterium]|jgi:uncharacterized protein (DUF427 family)|nr:DUF427 domain-containing protein [Kofleriaceae bacterium]
MTETDHVRLEPAKRIQIRAGGTAIADTTQGYIVHEGTLPARYYVPRGDVQAEITEGTGGGKCQWKGLWKHVDVKSGDHRIPNAAWTYYEPTPVCEPIRDFLAFYPDKVAIEVE